MADTFLGPWTAHTLHPSSLTSDDQEAWQALRAAHPDYATPLLSPGFAQLIGGIRADARVTLIRDSAGLAAVLPFVRRPDGLGRPLGAPFADYSGPVRRADAALTLTDIVRLAGLSAWRSTSMIDPWATIPEITGPGEATCIIRPGGQSPADYIEARRALYPKRFKNFRRLERQAMQDRAGLQFRWGAPDPALRDALFAYKSAQYRASGLVDLMTATNARAILDAVAASPMGFQTSLWSGDTFVSAHFGVREGRAFHPWIAAYDPQFAHYSPGNLLLKNIIEHMPQMELDEYDLAEGHDHYKKYYTNAARTVHDVAAIHPSLKGRYFALQQRVWNAAGRSGETSALRRVLRRIDHAAISEARYGARVGDFINAVRNRRNVSDQPAHASARGDDDS